MASAVFRRDTRSTLSENLWRFVSLPHRVTDFGGQRDLKHGVVKTWNTYSISSGGTSLRNSCCNCIKQKFGRVWSTAATFGMVQ